MKDAGLTRRDFMQSGSACLLWGSGAQAQQAVSPSLDKGNFGPFRRALNIQPHGYALISDPTGLAPIPKVERFEVRSGDCHFNAGWNDCENDRERSELSERTKESSRGQTSWYGWSFYVPPNWPDVWPTKTVLGQFHQNGSHPLWMFLNNKGGLVLDDQSSGRTKQLIPLISASDFKGRWHRIEIQATWANSRQGAFNVWVNDVPTVNYKGRTMTAKTVRFQYGVYRSFTSRFKAAQGLDAVPTQIAMFANVRKADSRAGLQPLG